MASVLGISTQRKNDFELRRFHPHMMVPYTNDNYSMKVLNHSSLTFLILSGSFLIGYIYARLTSDQYFRQTMYTRYANAMIIFDRYHPIYDKYYNGIKHTILDFNIEYVTWRLWQTKVQEYKETKKR